MTTLGDIIARGDVQHVIVLMQENRSFDEYFGTLDNVNGFGNVAAAAALTALQTAPGAPQYQPFRLSSFTRALNWPATPTGCSHSWAGQHASWAYGALNGWATDNNNSPIVLGYYLQDDIPYHWWLAQNFLLCDNYFCSVLGPTIPNRLYMVTGTAIDPSLDPASPQWPDPTTSAAFFGIDAAPAAGQSPADFAAAGNSIPGWKTYADFLSAAEQGGQPLWKVYDLRWDGDPYDNQDGSSQTVDLDTLTWFQSTWDAMFPAGYGVSSPHYGRGLAALAADVQANTVPKIAWVFPPYGYSEHPTYNAWDGAALIDAVLATLLGNEAVWSQTVLVMTYDENDGHYDHVPPVVPSTTVDNASGTSLPGPLPSRPAANIREFLLDDTGSYQPIGSGFRVPAFIVSPWTFQLPNGVCSVSFDHTSIIQFMEDVTGITAMENGVDNLTPWRRATFSSLSRVPAGNTPVSAATILAAGRPNAGSLATAPPPAGSIQAGADARQALLYAVQQNNANADVQQSYLPYPPAQSPPLWPPVPQSCQLIMRISSFQKATVTAQPGNSFSQAVLLTLTGFEPDELIDLNAVNITLQTITAGSGQCTCRVPNFTTVNAATGALQPGISCAASAISANPTQLAPGWASGLPYPFTYLCDLTFDACLSG